MIGGIQRLFAGEVNLRKYEDFTRLSSFVKITTDFTLR